MGNSMEVPQKLKIDLPCVPTIPFLGIYPKKIKSVAPRATCTPMFIVTPSTISKIWNQPKCPMRDEWLKKKWYTYTVEHYTAIKTMNCCPL